jgi:dipeptidyl aminopeptidase/acylaminoacyl peptidase
METITNPGRGNYPWIFKILVILLGVLLLSSNRAKAQGEFDVVRGESSNNSWLHFSDVSNSLYQHLAGQAYEILDQRIDTVAGLQTISDWQLRQKKLRETLMDITGPFPEKTPLNAEILRVVEKDGFMAEHIVYESQPGFYVTSSLFIPEGLQGKSPAVIYVSGHTNDGYRNPVYQHKILNLVKKGFIVFAIDPVGQGERLEYYDPQSGRSAVGGPTSEHSTPGVQAFITGSSQARFMIWDGIRAVDYLLARNEVDPNRIGITGRSGGGTQTALISAFDERIYASAPEAYITNHTRLLQTIGPQDAEQNLPGGIARGIDHADLLAVRAPKPALMITTTEDFFSIQGARETAKEVSEIYNAYGEKDNFNKVEDGGGHGSTEKNREAMYSFFQKHLDNPGSSDDEDVEILSEEEIQVTRTGQISTSLDGETVFSLNRREAESHIEVIKASRKDLPIHLPRVLESARKLSGYQEPMDIKEPVFTGRIQRDGYVIEKYFVKGEGDYPIPYLLMVPDYPNHKALIYLHPTGKAAEAAEGGEMEWFASRGFMVLAPDLIGVGETNPVGSGRLQKEWREAWQYLSLVGAVKEFSGRLIAPEAWRKPELWR